MALLLAACLLLAGPAASARAAGEGAASSAVLLLAELAKTGGAARYRALAEQGSGLDVRALAELTAADLEGGMNDPVERELLAGLLHQKLARPEGAPPPHGALAERVAGIVIPLAADPDWRVRLAAAELLGDLGSGKTLPTHRALLDDPVWPVRRAAIAALGALGPGGSASILAPLQARRDEVSIPERIEAVKAVARLGDVPGLLASLGDPYDEVQLNAVWGLSRLRNLPSEVVQALQRKQREAESREVRDEIRILLERPPAPPPPERKP
jgi:hypothetical protein